MEGNGIERFLEITPEHVQLKINEEIKESNSSWLNKITLAYISAGGNIVQGYVHNLKLFPYVSSIKDQYLKVIVDLLCDSMVVLLVFLL